MLLRIQMYRLINLPLWITMNSFCGSDLWGCALMGLGGP